MMIVSLLLAMQAAAAPVPAQSASAPAQAASEQVVSASDASENASPAARITMARYAACVLDNSADKADELLRSDFRTNSYRNGMRNLARNNDGCGRKVGLRRNLRMDGLPFAAALAEEGLRRMEGEPLNARLARAAAASKATPYTPSDIIAMCVARSVPDDVAALFVTEPGSDLEDQAIGKLMPVADMCAQDRKLDITPTGLRSIVATASYRLLAGMDT